MHSCSSSRSPPYVLFSSHPPRNGVEYCDGLSPAARAGIGLGFCKLPLSLKDGLALTKEVPHPPAVFLFLAILFGLLGYRRRRAARANLIYVQQPRPGDGGAYGYGGGPQYPPQAHYDPNSGFAPVRFLSFRLLYFLLLRPSFLPIAIDAARRFTTAILSAASGRAPVLTTETSVDLWPFNAFDGYNVPTSNFGVWHPSPF